MKPNLSTISAIIKLVKLNSMKILIHGARVHS